MAPAQTSQFTPEYLASLTPEYLSENIGTRLIDVAVAFMALETIFIVLFYISRHINKTLNGWDCLFLMPIAYIFCLATCICGILLVKFGGAGRHVEAVILDDPNIIITRSKIDKAMEYIYAVSIAPSKLAILCLYMRIFSSRVYRQATYLVGTVVLMTLLVSWLLSSTFCRPFTYQWDHSIPGGKCLDIMAVYTFISVPNIVTDVSILILPLPALYKLHVDLPTKVGIMLTFLTGSLGLITSILRMVEFINAAELFHDPTYRCIPTFTFTIVESGTYMMAACMPTLRPLKRKLFKDTSITRKVMSTIDRLSGKSTGSSSADLSTPKGWRWGFSHNVPSDMSKTPKDNARQCPSTTSETEGFIRLRDLDGHPLFGQPGR